MSSSNPLDQQFNSWLEYERAEKAAREKEQRAGAEILGAMHEMLANSSYWNRFAIQLSEDGTRLIVQNPEASMIWSAQGPDVQLVSLMIQGTQEGTEKTIRDRDEAIENSSGPFSKWRTGIGHPLLPARSCNHASVGLGGVSVFIIGPAPFFPICGFRRTLSGFVAEVSLYLPSPRQRP
jgi:hypothetical protein